MTEGQVRIVTLSTDLKKVYLYNFHKKFNAKFVPFAGYNMPINYKDGILKEHEHTRNFAGLFDVSHMGQILIPYNENNIETLLKYIPINIDNLKMNKSYYSFLLNDRGGIIDDLIISRLFYKNVDYFYIVYNASRKIEDEKIFTKFLSDIIFLKDNSLLAIQGPKSEEILNFLDNINELSFMEIKSINYKDNQLIISRSGYTGEDGFELSIPNKIVDDLISFILKNNDLKLCGLGSRDSLRIEAGLSLYGNELNEELTPVEANLTWSIHKNRLNDGKLNGSNNILNQIDSGVENIRIGFKPRTKIMLRSEIKICDINKKQIGIITSGGFSPILNSSIALGYISRSNIKDETVYCLVRDRLEELSIVNLPFVEHNYKRGA